MNRSTFHIVTALCGAIAGILIGRLSTAGGSPPASPGGGPVERQRTDQRQASPARSSGGKHDFVTLVKMRQQGRLNDSSLTLDLERLNARELRDLLTELRDQPKTDDLAEKAGRVSLFQNAAWELFRREGMEALTWADGMEDGSFRTDLMWHLTTEASYQSPVLAKPWIDRFLEENGEGSINAFRWKLMAGAQSRGAEAVIELEKLFGERFSTIQKPAIPYPEGFDYHKLFTSIPPTEWGFSHSMYYWASVDKEAAWKGIQETINLYGKNGASYFGELFNGAGGFEDDPETRKWALGKLNELPDALRENAVKSLSPSPSNAIPLMRELPRESDRVTLVSTLIGPLSENGKILPAIRELGSQNAMKAALLSAAQNWRIGDQSPEAPGAKRILEKFAGLTEELGFTPESKAQVDAALRGKR